MRIPEVDTNLRRALALLGELANLVDDLVGRGLEPCGRRARVRNRGGRDTLAVAVKATHFGGVVEGV